MGDITQYLDSDYNLNNLDQGYILHKRIIDYNKQYDGKGYAKPLVTLYYYKNNESFSYLESINMYVPLIFNNGKGFIVQKADGKLYLYLVPQNPFKNLSSVHGNQQYLGYLVNLHKDNQDTDLTFYTWSSNLKTPNLYFANSNNSDGTDMEIQDTATLNSLFLGYQVSYNDTQSAQSSDYIWIPTPNEIPTLDLMYTDNNKSLVINLTDNVVLDSLQNNSVDIINQLCYE